MPRILGPPLGHRLSAPVDSSGATHTWVSAPNPPPMADPEELEAARRLATLALAELSRGCSSSTPPPCPDLPPLRRCLQLLPLLNAGDPSLAARCCRGLFASLGSILSCDPSPSLLPALEVFAGSLVFSDCLKGCLAMANNAAPEGSKIFAEACQGGHHIVLELVCRHFISSLQDEEGFEVFLSALSWSGNRSQETPEISFHGAFGLINRTSLLSFPAVVQAHLLLLASRCISDQDLGSHLLAFEHAMNLYVRYLPELHVFNRTGGVKIPLCCLVKEKPFSCCINGATDQKLKSQINRLLSFCQLHSGDGLPTNESDIDRLIEENQHMFHEKLRQESTKLMKIILSNILHCAKQKEVQESDAEVSGGIICLAAVLRVMSSSFLCILHYFSQTRSASDKENVNYAMLSQGYNVIYETIRLLGQHEANELHRYDLHDIIGMPVDRESAPMLMLAHFATLSIFCVRRRLGFLWKGCIMMMIMSVNLIAEKEYLATFQLSIDVSKESAALHNTKERIREVSARTKAIASRYETIHKIHRGRHINADGSSLQTPQVRKADGRAFLELHPKYSADWNDIMDFVECEEGKDYSNTLKRHQRFMEFNHRRWRRLSNISANILGLKPRM